MKRRLMFLIIFLITTFIVFLIITFSPKDYIYFYQKGDVLISEEFSKKDKEYLITAEYDNNKYYYKFKHKYLRKRGLLDEVKISDSCVSPSSKYYQFYKTCINEEGYFFDLKNESLDKPVKKYERINIYDYNDHKYFIWNYTNFIVIDEDNIEKINLFKKDVYKMDMIVRINDDLLVADYNQKYQFDKMYLINLENNKVSDFTINRKLYLDGYILGTYKNDVYIYDVSKETEYKINPYKERITKSGYGIYNNGSWESISINKLNKKNCYFIENKAFILEDNALYFNGINGKIKVYDNVTNIVEQDDTSVYFVKDNTLYYASIYGTLKKIMSYSEWKFNSSNIYIY